MSQNEEIEDEGMTFWEHLQELRSRLVKMVLAIAVGSVAAWFLKEQILSWLVEPFKEAWLMNGFDERPELHFPDPAGLFIAYLKLTFVGGVVLALPVIFYQLWSFVAPGLYAREKRFAIPFVTASTLLFAGGAYYGMKIAFPIAFNYLLSYAGNLPDFHIRPTIMVDQYISFITHMLVAFGAAAELPVVIFFLSVAGVINHRHLIRFFRYFIVLAFVAGAILTPPDLLSQFLLAIPLCVLYVLSIGISWIFARKRSQAASESSASSTS